MNIYGACIRVLQETESIDYMYMTQLSAIYFIRYTHSNIHLIQKHLYRHTQNNV